MLDVRPAALAFDVLAILAALLVKFVPFSPAWIEAHYSNGAYPPIDRAVRALTGPLPFTIGDVLFFAAAIGFVVWWIRALRDTPRGKKTGRAARLAFRTLALLAVVYVWFDLSWAFNYDRIPLADKIPVHDERATAVAVDKFADHVVDEIGRAHV